MGRQFIKTIQDMRGFCELLVISVLASFANAGLFKCEKASETTSSGSRAKPGPYCPGELIFQDDFDTLDFDTWNHELTLAGGGNWEFQWYLNNRSNSFVENGTLNIRPTLLADDTGEAFLSSGVLNIHGGAPADSCTNPAFYGCERTGFPNNILNPIKSARLRSIYSFNFKYGKVEVKAKMPTGDWLWPAVWLMPKSNAYGTWPASGEIDLLESRGNLDYKANGVHIGVEQVGSTLHFGPYPALNGYEYTMAVMNTKPDLGFNKAFHLYQLEWTPDYLRFSIDGVYLSQINGSFWELGQFDKRAPGTENPWRLASKIAPFDQEFYLIMNLAVGGSQGYFPDEGVNAGYPKPWQNYAPTSTSDFWKAKDKWLPTWKLNETRSKEASLLVDYVKVWAL